MNLPGHARRSEYAIRGFGLIAAVVAVLASGSLAGCSRLPWAQKPPVTPSNDATTAPVDQAAAQASAMRALLTESQGYRTSVKTAVADVKQCHNLDASVTAFEQAGTARASEHVQAGALEISHLTNGEQLRSALVSALQASARADNAFAAWARSRTDGSCVPGSYVTSDFRAASDASVEATGYKQSFVGLWNPIAQTYGWPTLLYTDI